jgi:hypothetical protein
MLAFLRLGGWTGNVSAQVSGFSLNQMISVLIGIAAGSILVLSMASASDVPVAVTFTVFFAIAPLFVLILLYRSKVTLEDTGICIGPAYRNRLFIPFDRVSSIALNKNILKAVMSKRPPLNFSRTHRFLLLGDIEIMKNELNRVAPFGAPTHIPATPEFKQSGQVGPKIVFAGKDKSNLTLAGILLIVAGLFAFLTAALFFALEDYSAVTGSPLYCCGSLEILFGAIIILGGLQTIRRVKYSLAMLAAVLAVISVGFTVSIVLGIVALVMIHRSRDDFRD